MNEQQARERATELAYKHPHASSGAYAHVIQQVCYECYMAAWQELNPSRPVFGEIADILRRWEVADGNIGRFDRGLHLLGHQTRGGTLEEYGEPNA